MHLIIRLIKIIIPVALLIVGVNDLGRYFQAQYQIGNVARDAVVLSADTFKKSNDRTGAWRAGEALAEQHGATVYGFDVTNGRVYVWAKMPVAGTWAAHRVYNVLDNKPQSAALYVQADDSSIIP